MKVDGLILAAGVGKRLGRGPKAFLELKGQTLVERVAILARPFVQNIAIAVQPEHIEKSKNLLPWCTIIAGGSNRQQSLKRLLEHTEASYVVIFDAARAFTSPQIIEQLLKTVPKYGASIPCLPASVPNIITSDPTVIEHLTPSKNTFSVQTPQAYRRDNLLEIYELAKERNWAFQSTVELLHAAKRRTTMVAGSESNIKITTELDWQIAQHILT
ncbi:MAG: 2-C-methyl-D-erythritol 4-phosphate cytidylyltransferase [Magnetococcales bacterium]|nr:2-C-methyl-D-erythritol 4-phosphate cytidylyltransferase [Magnetococcales bacterium]